MAKTEITQTPAGTVRLRPYLSPSAVQVFEKDPNEFFLKYLAVDRPPKEQQTQPMGVGSVFDAYPKMWAQTNWQDLIADDQRVYGHENSKAVFGDADAPPFIMPFSHDKGLSELGKLEIPFQEGEGGQIETRELAFMIWHQYKDSGALGQINKIFEEGARSGTVSDIRYECRWQTNLAGRDKNGNQIVGGGSVPVLGLPDLCWLNPLGNNGEGSFVILDWKVNGACAQNMASPAGGYKWARQRAMGASDKLIWQEKKARGGWKQGVPKKWAFQLGTYVAIGQSLTGRKIGADGEGYIHQLCCQRLAQKVVKTMPVIHHAPKFDIQYDDLIARYQACWAFCENPLTHMTQPEVDAAQRTAAALRGELGEDTRDAYAEDLYDRGF